MHLNNTNYRIYNIWSSTFFFNSTRTYTLFFTTIIFFLISTHFITFVWKMVPWKVHIQYILSSCVWIPPLSEILSRDSYPTLTDTYPSKYRPVAFRCSPIDRVLCMLKNYSRALQWYFIGTFEFIGGASS